MTAPVETPLIFIILLAFFVISVQPPGKESVGRQRVRKEARVGRTK